MKVRILGLGLLAACATTRGASLEEISIRVEGFIESEGIT